VPLKRRAEVSVVFFLQPSPAAPVASHPVSPVLEAATATPTHQVVASVICSEEEAQVAASVTCLEEEVQAAASVTCLEEVQLAATEVVI
jgi:hypothetical protein